MKQVIISILMTILMSLIGTKVYAFKVANSDGVEIEYDYIKDGTELAVGQNSSLSGSVVIPEEVTYMDKTRKVTAIGEYAFFCSDLVSITIPNSVTTIGGRAFSQCTKLTTVTLSNNLESIGDGAFAECDNLSSITIPNSVTSIGNSAFYYCSGLSSITIPNSVTSIGEYVFNGCSSLKSISIPNSITSIKNSTFNGCSALTSLTLPNSITSIGMTAFAECSSLTIITIPKSVTSIETGAFRGCKLTQVISFVENPFNIDKYVFDEDTYYNATLYVPKGTIEKYKDKPAWNLFTYIEEGTGGGGSTTSEKCEKPTISYSNGKLTFQSGTGGATCQYNITDTDIKAGSGNEVQLAVTYSISVYATKTGYEDSETVKATLCWIDQQPTMEGITNDISQISARAVLIQGQGGMLTIQGVDEGSTIAVYTISGQMVGSIRASGNHASLATNIKKGEVAIIKIGEKSVKVVMQ